MKWVLRLSEQVDPLQHIRVKKWKCEMQRQKESFKDAKEKKKYP